MRAHVGSSHVALAEVSADAAGQEGLPGTGVRDR